jgi:hypothetical protein
LVVVASSNRGSDEWLATFADPVPAQSAIDHSPATRMTWSSNGESYRPLLKPSLGEEGKERSQVSY